MKLLPEERGIDYLGWELSLENIRDTGKLHSSFDQHLAPHLIWSLVLFEINLADDDCG